MGKTILARKPGSAPHLQIVLARCGEEYVTWLENSSTSSGKPFYAWGHYFQALDEAQQDYEKRYH